MMDFSGRLRSDRVVIFLFHGVIEKQTHAVRNYTRKHLQRDYFVSSLKGLLEAGGNPVSMDDILQAHRRNVSLPPYSFAITFDDGFRNNLTVAVPILEDLAIPATFYVTTDFIESNRMSWIDRIEWAMEAASPGRIDLPWDEHVSFSTADSRRQLLDDIRANAKTNPSISLDGLASSIQQQLGFRETWASTDHLDIKMTWHEVGQLNSHPLFTVGGHSHTHPILAFLPPERLAAELDTSLSLLKTKAGIGPDHYSYPEGLAHCFSDEVIANLRARGVKICPSAIDGDNDVATDPFRLHRVMAV